MDFFTDFGYPGLFLASFLAATILPLNSEVVLGYLIADKCQDIVNSLNCKRCPGTYQLTHSLRTSSGLTR